MFFEGDKKHGFRPIDYVEGMTCPDEVILPNLPKQQDRFKFQLLCSQGSLGDPDSAKNATFGLVTVASLMFWLRNRAKTLT